MNIAVNESTTHFISDKTQEVAKLQDKLKQKEYEAGRYKEEILKIKLNQNQEFEKYKQTL